MYIAKKRTRTRKNLDAAVRKYNAAITRMSKKPEYKDVILPKKITSQEVMERSMTAKGLNREIKLLNYISNPNAKKVYKTQNGTKYTGYQKYLNTQNLRLINRERKKERLRIEANVSKEKGNTRFAQRQDIQPKQNRTNEQGYTDFIRYADKLVYLASETYRLSKQEQYKQNYLKAIKNRFGSAGADLYKKVASIPAQVLYDNYYKYDHSYLEYIYEPLQADLILKNVADQWQSEYDDTVDIEEYEKLWEEWEDESI